MKIRKGTAVDMPAVLRLIKELATFENEPDAVVLTVEDLVRDGFSDTPSFYTFVAEENAKIIGVALYYYKSLQHIFLFSYKTDPLILLFQGQ